MLKEKYDFLDFCRIYIIMFVEEVVNGKKFYWVELEISGEWNLKYFIWNIIVIIVKSIVVFIGFLLCFNWKN